MAYCEWVIAGIARGTFRDHIEGEGGAGGYSDCEVYYLAESNYTEYCIANYYR